MADTETLVRLGPAPAPEAGRAQARILVIDDNAIVLESFRETLANNDAAPALEALETLGTTLFGSDAAIDPPGHALRPTFDVDLVPDGAQGCRCVLDAVRQGRPYAVAFVDMRMPGGWDGMQTIEALWRADPGIQVVICTAYSDHSWDDITARLGRSDRLLILRKPFEAIEVLQLASSLSRKWHLQCLQEARLTELEEKVEARVAELSRANRTLLMLTQCNETLVRADSEAELLQAICRHIVQVGGYRLAWVGFARHDEARSVEPVAHAGTDRDYVDNLHLTWGSDACRQGVGGAAIREGCPKVARRISADTVFAPWRDDALSRGFASCIALPLQHRSETFGTLSIYSEEADAFDAEETRLLVELADNLAYGITSLRETQQRRTFERELERQASFDMLTGLPNRHLLNDRSAQSIAQAKRSGQRVAMLFLDLDDFKYINDSCGHAGGDALLRAVAARLQAMVRESDTVARWGGDEFVILLSGLAQAEDVRNVAQKVVAAFAVPFMAAGQELHVTASLGISLYPEDGRDSETLLKHADAAMYRAKEHGGNGLQFYDREMEAQAEERVAMHGALCRATQRQEFELHYQPQVDLRSGRIRGVEALIRWRSPGLGMVAPDRFISLAEETGLIVPIGEWVLRTACAQAKAWHAAGHAGLQVAVNLSARQFRQQDVAGLVRDALAESGLAAKYLELELTESVLMKDGEAVAHTLHQLKAMGVSLALDDFGTGYSSLSYLKRFPIDVVKIDRAFVRDVTVNADDAALTRAIIAMARSLNMSTVAEGVETLGQLSFVIGNGCDAMQGYYFSRPLPVDEMTALLRDGRHLAIDGLVKAPALKHVVDHPVAAIAVLTDDVLQPDAR